MHRIAFAFLALLLAACEPYAPPPTATPGAPTATPRPTATIPPPVQTLEAEMEAVATHGLPTPTPTPPLADLKALMLELVNEARAAAGVGAVSLGSNQAAQHHAEAALEGCYSSHWDRWGLMPNHRYTLAGGRGSDFENVSGLDYCITDDDGYRAIYDMREEVAETVEDWLGSPGHRKTILRPESTILNIGIAANRYNENMVQHFSSGYVVYSSLPAIDSHGLLSLAGKTSWATPGLDGFASVTIVYDAPPRPLTRGQLTATHAACKGQKVAYLRKPGRDVVVKTVTESPLCIDPYRVLADRQPPGSYEESRAGWRAAQDAAESAPEVTYRYKGIPSERMDFTADSFRIEADVSGILEEYGPGIYRVLLWGVPVHMEKGVVISEQSIFWGVEPPADAPY